MVIADLPSSKGAQLASELKEENALFTPVDVSVFFIERFSGLT